jgi:hypothetical protein
MSIEQILLLNSGFLALILVILLIVTAFSNPRPESKNKVSKDIDKIKEQIND